MQNDVCKYWSALEWHLQLSWLAYVLNEACTPVNNHPSQMLFFSALGGNSMFSMRVFHNRLINLVRV